MNNKLVFTNCLLLSAFSSAACFGAQGECGATLDRLSPYAARLLKAQGTRSRFLFSLEGLDVWVTQPADQQAVLVLTTQNGLLIRGSIFGPDGQDIATVLGGTSPAKPPAAAGFNDGGALDANPGKQAAEKAASANDKQAQLSPRATSEPDAIPTFTSRPQLRSQAETYLMWIEANHAQPNAPVLYMFTDPLCSLCSRSLRVLKPYLDRGAIELRLIPTPILSPTSFTLAISFVQDPNPGEAFIQHAFRTTDPQPPTLAPNEMDKAVIDAMARNLQWFRRNGLQGVPLFLYRAGSADEMFYGQIDDNRIKTILQRDTIREGDRRDP